MVQALAIVSPEASAAVPRRPATNRLVARRNALRPALLRQLANCGVCRLCPGRADTRRVGSDDVVATEQQDVKGEERAVGRWRRVQVRRNGLDDRLVGRSVDGARELTNLLQRAQPLELAPDAVAVRVDQPHIALGS